jgi:hypothetical protein
VEMMLKHYGTTGYMKVAFCFVAWNFSNKAGFGLFFQG